MGLIGTAKSDYILTYDTYVWFKDYKETSKLPPKIINIKGKRKFGKKTIVFTKTFTKNISWNLSLNEFSILLLIY